MSTLERALTILALVAGMALAVALTGVDLAAREGVER